ncbi:MAG: CotH kinase family protein, partial [Myxococcota bacterium]
VSLAVACATGVAPAAVAVVSIPGGISASGDALSWPTGLADAGPRAFVVAVGDHGVPETAVGTAWVADRYDDPANVPVDPLTYTQEFGVPVLHLDPTGALSQDYVAMSAWWDGDPYAGTIKIRGAASAGYPKPSYTLEFEPDQLDLDDLGLGHKDHLVLISNFDDSSYVRQKLVFDTWAAIAADVGTPRLTPRTAFVVVYLDGVYQGLYTAIDHVDDEFVEEMGFDPTANVYKSIDHNANFYLTDVSGAPKAVLHLGWEKKEGLPVDDFADLDALTAFTGGCDAPTFDAEIDAWIDRTEFMDWLRLVHWFAADDSGGKNAYLVHDPVTGLFRYTPWDFNQSLGQNWYTARVEPDVYNDFVWTNRVFWQFVSDPTMNDEVWTGLLDQAAPGGPFDPAVLRAATDGYYAEIEPSATRDWAKWESAYWAYFGWARSDRTGFADERTYVEGWIADRAAYIATVH